MLTRLINSAAWTGGDVTDAVTLPRPPIKSAKIAAKAVQPTRDGYLAEYAELAQLVGVASPDLGIETFKDFLRKQDWGIFSLAEVVVYMDKKAAAESKDKAGWQWRPLRVKDHVFEAAFGVEAMRNQHGQPDGSLRPASDHYEGPRRSAERQREWRPVKVTDSSGKLVDGIQSFETGHFHQILPSRHLPYDKTIPLHALRKVAAIERDFKTVPVAFFVCDYAPAPQIPHPDPFLMAVIDNPKLKIGIGRFVIDFWDEPGFGLDQMMK